MTNNDEHSLEPSKYPLQQRPAHKRFAVIVVLVVFLVVDLVTLPLGNAIERFNDNLLLVPYVLVGVILAQFACAATWLVFGFGRTRIRLLFLCGFSFAAIVLWSMGRMTQSFWRLDRLIEQSIWPTIMCTPIILTSIAIPLWLARGWLGWRIVREDSSDPVYSISILDFMKLTAVFGVAITLPRFAHRTLEPTPIILGSLCVGGAVGTFVVLPLIAAVFRSRNVFAAIGLTFYSVRCSQSQQSSICS